MRADSLTLSAFVERHYRHKPEIAGGSPRSLAEIRSQVANFGRYLAREPLLSDLTKAHLQAAMSWQLSQGRTRDTANKLLRTLRALWSYAAEMEPPLCDPPLCGPPRMRQLSVPQREPEAWSIDQFQRILAAARRLKGQIGKHPAGDWWAAILLTAWNTGARKTALMMIRRDWIDLPARQLVIEADVQKDQESIRATLQAETVEALLPLMPDRAAVRVFQDWPYDRNGTEWATLTRWLRKLIVAAGLRATPADVTHRDLWHKIRRTFATYICAVSDLETARRMLGHSSVEVTRRYIDQSKLGQKSQADLLPRLDGQQLRLFG